MKFIEKILKESNDHSTYEIFCDMDGVLCDFLKGWHELTGEKIEGHKSLDWTAVDEHPSFWADLEWMSDGKDLWNYIKKYKPHILSSPSESKTAEMQKRIWIKRELGNTVSEQIFVKKERKREFASPTNILIDDYEQNIEDWIADGGIGILHTSAQHTIRQLKLLGL